MFCGECANYRSRPNHEDFCNKTGKVVGYLAKKDCFEPKQPITMTETNSNNLVMIERSSGDVSPTKLCKCCGRERPIAEFGKHWKTADGLFPICNECRSEKAKETHRAPRKEKSEKKNTAPEAKSVKTQAIIETIGDNELVAELRRRGWEVKCAKSIIVTL